MKLQDLEFIQVEMRFDDGFYTNVFADKNNKTVLETLKGKKYIKFTGLVNERYSNYLQEGLGGFILKLKNENDDNHKLFSNKYGDLKYSVFRIEDKIIINKKGIYFYLADNEVKYIGRCRDNFKKRINQGYGKIHPKNCFIDGQATNCHLNSLIANDKEKVSLWICPLEDDTFIEKREKELIKIYNPIWNTQLKKWGI